IRALVLHCPQAINIVNTAHQSPLSILADKSHADCVRLLLSNGADPLPVMPSIVSTAVAFLRGDIGGPKADPFGTMEALLGYNCLHHPKDFSLAAYFPPDSGARASELLVAPAPTSSLCGSLSSLALAKLRILYLVFIIMFKLPSGPAWIAAIKRAILSTATDAQDQSELPESAIEAGRTLTEWLSQPPSLLLSTALKVHSLLGPANYSAKIDRLPLPSALKRQLFLVDVRPV
uniref:ANK_REP_REGION domain-containing protein n=1 Tax=Macrostomum lignano TaxID=282301 RepID=A0A1I8GEX2_9PLAT